MTPYAIISCRGCWNRFGGTSTTRVFGEMTSLFARSSDNDVRKTNRQAFAISSHPARPRVVGHRRSVTVNNKAGFDRARLVTSQTIPIRRLGSEDVACTLEARTQQPSNLASHPPGRGKKYEASYMLCTFLGRLGLRGAASEKSLRPATFA